MHSVFVVGIDNSVRQMFVDRGWTISPLVKEADALCFTGGADISPFLYGQKAHPTTSAFISRDMEEIAMWKDVKPSVPKLGICRGMQLGNVLCGGSMWQHVDKHSNYQIHGINMVDRKGDEKREVNSLHHQMVKPTDEAIIIATTKHSTMKEDFYHKVRNPSDADVEALYYHNFNFLGVQWHPEYDHKPSTDLFFDLIDEYIQLGQKKRTH